ncbi:MAG: hypothetical protein V3S83_12390 [Gemmatimonadota bacterium]
MKFEIYRKKGEAVWTWQPGDPSTGSGDLGGPEFIFYPACEAGSSSASGPSSTPAPEPHSAVMASQLTPETQQIVKRLMERIQGLGSRIGEYERKERCAKLVAELEGLGYEGYVGEEDYD